MYGLSTKHQARLRLSATETHLLARYHPPVTIDHWPTLTMHVAKTVHWVISVIGGTKKYHNHNLVAGKPERMQVKIYGNSRMQEEFENVMVY